MPKIRCKNAARRRRSDENDELKQLSDMLPLNTCNKALDKATVVRLTTANLLLKEFIEGFEGAWSSAEHMESCDVEELGSHMLQCLDGFLLIIGHNGKIIYVSETVSNYLGVSQLEMTGELLWGHIHPEDKPELEAFLNSSIDSPVRHGTEESTKLPVKFIIRMKCTLSRRNCGLMIGGFKIIHCSGYFKYGLYSSSQSEGNVTYLSRNRRQQGCGLLLYCHTLPSSIGTGIRLSPHVFMLRLGMDFTISYADGEVFSLTGYEPSHLNGKKLYNFIHPLHLFQIQRHHIFLLHKDQVISQYYALLINGGGWIWIQSYFSRMKSAKPTRDYIVACNYVISECQHLNQVIEEEQMCMLNTCCKVLKPNKRTTTSSNCAVSKRSNNLFRCCFSSEVGRQDDNDVTSGKMKVSSKESYTQKGTTKNQSFATGNFSQMKYQGLICTANFIPEQLCNNNNPISINNTNQSLQMLSKNHKFQNVNHNSNIHNSLPNFHQGEDNKAFKDTNGKSSLIQNCHITSSHKEHRYFEFQKSSDVKPTNYGAYISHQQTNNNENTSLAYKSNGNILNQSAAEKYLFTGDSEETVAVSKKRQCDSFTQKPESILKTLLSKSPNIHHPSTSRSSQFSLANSSIFSYYKDQLVRSTTSKMNLELPIADDRSQNYKQPKLLSPVTETALDLNCLHIQSSTHCENDTSKGRDTSIYIKEFPSTSTNIRSNREMPPDFSSANSKRIRSYYNSTDRNYPSINYGLPIQKPQMEINNNQPKYPGTEKYLSLLDNTHVGFNTKHSFDLGQSTLEIKASAAGILGKENLPYENTLTSFKSTRFQTYKNNNYLSCPSTSQTTPWNIGSNFQWTGMKVISRLEKDQSDFNINFRHQCAENKVLSSSLESNRSDIDANLQGMSSDTKTLSSNLKSNADKYYPCQSLDSKNMRSNLESNRLDIDECCQSKSSKTEIPSSSLTLGASESEIYFPRQCFERKFNCPSFESTMASSHCSDNSPDSLLNEFPDDDFCDITTLDMDSSPESLFSSLEFENTSQLVSDLPNTLISML